MRIRELLIGVMTLAVAGTVSAQVQFMNVTSNEEMDAVWKTASESNMAVFVDVYATWCGPCKWMDSNVFAKEEAGNYLNARFINVKMNGESPFGSVFARENGLQAYPSLFVFNAEKKLMNMLVGAKPWEELEASLQNTLEFFPILELYESKFKSALLSPDEYPAYVNALRKMNKEEDALSVVDHYRSKIMTEGKLTKRDIKVLAFFSEPGTDEWAYLTRDIDKLKAALGVDLREFIEKSHDKTILLSVEEFDLAIAEQYIILLPELVKGTDLNADEMETRSYVYYFHYSQEFDALIEHIDSVYATQKKGDHEWLFKAAADAVFLDPGNTKMTEKGIEWFQTCLNEKESYDYYFHKGLSQYFAYKADESIESFKKAGEFATSDEERETVKGVIAEIEAE